MDLVSHRPAPSLSLIPCVVGTGKTFLTSKIIHELLSTIRANSNNGKTGSSDQALAYFYCVKGDPDLNYESIIRCMSKLTPDLGGV